MASKFGNKIRLARLTQGLTMEDLGKRLGTTSGKISTWELGKVLPRPHALKRLAAVLDIDPQELAQLWMDCKMKS